MNILRRGLLWAVLSLLPTWACAQFDLAWSRTTADQVGVHLALDAQDNAYSVGYHTFGYATVMKFAPDGSLLWTRSITGSSAARAVWVDTDAAGNAWVLVNHVKSSNGSPFGIILSKFAPDGTLLWQDSLIATLAYGLRVYTDAQGNGYVFGSLPALEADTVYNVVYKYAPDGTRLWRAPQNMRTPQSMRLTGDGRILVSGYGAGAFMVNEVIAAADGQQLFLASLPSASGGVDIAPAPDGGFVSVGQAPSGPSGSVYEFLVVRYDSAYQEVWRRTYDVGDRALRVGLDASGNIFATGFIDILFDWMTVKLNPAGDVLWSRRLNTHLYNDELPNWLLVQPDGSVVVAGVSGPGPTTGNLSFTQAGLMGYGAAGGDDAGWLADSGGARALVVQRGSTGALFLQAAAQQKVMRVEQGGAGTIGIDNWPVAKASATTPVSGNAPLTVGFSSAGTTDPDRTAVTTLWNFGDGTTSTEPDPTHTFGTAGTFDVTMTATDLVGHQVSATPVRVQVTNAPAEVTPTAIQLSVASVKGGTTLTATVVVSGVGGVDVAMRSSSAKATVPAVVTVAANDDRANFSVKTRRVRRNTPVTLTATANGVSVSTVVTLTP